MTNRFLLKQFAANATNNGVFGSYDAGNPTITNNETEIQSLDAWLDGWIKAVSSGSQLPKLEEMQGLQYVICKAVKELYSEGIPVWLAGEVYYQYNSICSYIDESNNYCLYMNLTGQNGENPPSNDTTNWKKIFDSSDSVTNKLNTDLSNITDAGKINIRELFKYDTANPIIVTNGATLTKGGMLMVRGAGLNTSIQVFVNGAYTWRLADAGQQSVDIGNMFLVFAGDVITTAVSNATGVNMQLYPFLGE